MGHILMRVRITPDNLTQSHSFEFDIDQSYLARVVAQCADALFRFPVRGGSGS